MATLWLKGNYPYFLKSNALLPVAGAYARLSFKSIMGLADSLFFCSIFNFRPRKEYFIPYLICSLLIKYK